MLGFEVCTPQRDMKDKQMRQKTRTVLQYFEAVAKSAKSEKKKDGRWPLPSIQQYRLHTCRWDPGSPMA